MDEMYSYGLMNYNKLNIADNEDFLNNWHDKNYYKDYLEVNSNEIFDLIPVYKNQKNDVHPPLYYLLLRVFASFSIDKFSKWTGIILNIIVFAISNIFIYLICKKLFKNPIHAIIVCIINGFTLIALDSAIYIRMYELCNLNILAITYLHIRIFNKENLTVKDLIPISICLMIGGLTHYYYFVYVVVLYLIYVIKCIKSKKYKNLIKYTVFVTLSAITYLIIFPYSISHIFFGYRGINNNNDIGIFVKTAGYLNILNNRIFNNLFILLVIITYLICRKKTKKNIKFNSDIKLLIIPIIVYLLLVIYQSPYVETRYIIPIYSSIIITTIYFIKQYIYKHYSNKATLFILTLLFLIIIYSPKLTNNNLEFTYEKYGNIAQKVEDAKLPIIYIFNTKSNRILDDLYLFTLVDKTIVIDSNNEEKIKEMLDTNKQYILICNEGVNEEQIKSYINENIEFMRRTNACNIYINN